MIRLESARLLAGELPTFFRDGPIFARPNHQYADPRILSGDILVSGNTRIGRLIQFDTEKLQLAASRAARFRRILPDSSSEDERVHSSQHGGHRADASLQAMSEDVERQPG